MVLPTQFLLNTIELPHQISDKCPGSGPGLQVSSAIETIYIYIFWDVLCGI